MYKFIKSLKNQKRIKKEKSNAKILGMAIMMFISFSVLNIFLIFNFISILNTI